MMTNSISFVRNRTSPPVIAHVEIGKLSPISKLSSVYPDDGVLPA